jgi:phage terminase large subunit GpA-like protein
LDIVNEFWGLKWEIKHGRILKKSIVFVCSSKSCQREIRETKKPDMLINGKWHRTGKAINEYTASFHINGLYSPFLSWLEMAQSAQDALEDPQREPAYQNLKMGKPYKLKGSRPEVKKVKENRGKYKSASVPWGVLYITAGVDVQRGSEKYKDMPEIQLEKEIRKFKKAGKFEPFPRIELEFLGIGAGYRTWSIDYLVFNGHVTDPFSGAWEKFFQYSIKNKLSFERKQDGRIFPVRLIFIDSNDWYSADAVTRFCSRITNTYPCKGMGELKRRKDEKADEVAERDFIRYRPVRVGDGKVYEIYTNYYKKQIYHNLKIPRKPEGEQYPGFCDFPVNYGDRYFQGLTAEEYLEDGSFEAGKRRNEPLDCRVYSLCAGDAFLDAEIERIREVEIEKGKSRAESKLIGGREVLQAMIKGILRKGVSK